MHIFYLKIYYVYFVFKIIIYDCIIVTSSGVLGKVKQWLATQNFVKLFNHICNIRDKTIINLSVFWKYR